MKQQSGFTIIETLVYLGLFGIVMAGIIVAAYSTFELTDRIKTKAMLTAEGNFLLSKINWAMSGVQTINLPAVGCTVNCNALSVDKWDTGIGNPVQVTLDPVSGKIRIQKASGPIYDLNNADTNVDSLVFDHQGTGTNPEWLTATFVLSAKTPNGQTVAQTFTTTKYLRK